MGRSVTVSPEFETSDFTLVNAMTPILVILKKPLFLYSSVNIFSCENIEEVNKKIKKQSLE